MSSALKSSLLFGFADLRNNVTAGTAISSSDETRPFHALSCKVGF